MKRFIACSVSLVCVFAMSAVGQNKVVFDNQSGEPALVKLIGPTQTEVEVPNGAKTGTDAAAGRYIIKVRYGTPAKYHYSKGEEFEVTETAKARSETTITLHKVTAGNYESQPISETEFGAQSGVSSPPAKTLETIVPAANPKTTEGASTAATSTSGAYGRATGVVKTPWGKPKANREIHLLSVFGKTYSEFKTTKTDSEGRWVMEDVPPGMYADWHSDVPDRCGFTPVQVNAGKTTDFGTFSEADRDDSTPRDLARRGATPYLGGTSALLISGFYDFQKDKNTWYCLRFYEDGTASSGCLGVGPESTAKWYNDYPYGGDWGQFRVDGSNVVVTTKNEYGAVYDWKCVIIEQGKKLAFSRLTHVGESISTDAGTMSFHEVVWGNKTNNPAKTKD